MNKFDIPGQDYNRHKGCKRDIFSDKQIRDYNAHCEKYRSFFGEYSAGGKYCVPDVALVQITVEGNKDQCCHEKIMDAEDAV